MKAADIGIKQSRFINLPTHIYINVSNASLPAFLEFG